MGALMSFNPIFLTTNSPGSWGTFKGRKFESGNFEINYEGNWEANEVDLERNHFYSAGIFFEALVGRSNFVNLQLSRNFASSVLSSTDYTYSIEGGSPINKTIESSYNGTVLEIGFRKPLRVFKIKKKLLKDYE